MHAGDLIREWRQRRRLSQLDLAIAANVSSRHLSFVETGRSRPTSEMILHLAEHLEVPLRDRNALLLVDGSWQADWKISQGSLEIRPFIRLNPANRDAIAAEGERLLGFADPSITVRDVRFVPVRSG